MKATGKKILVIVPAYNESGSIKGTLQEIRQTAIDLDVVVIDDGSTDGTRDDVSSLGEEVVSLPFNLGIGGAVQTGFLYAEENDYDVVVRIDGDGQHDVRYLGDLLQPVLNDEVDIVVGSRFIPPFLGYRSSLIRRVGIHFFANLLSWLTRSRITDSTSGFQAFHRNAVKVFAESYPHDFPEPESVVVAKRTGLRMKEVPVQMRKRSAGHSSIRYLVTLYYMVKVTFAVFISMIKKQGGAQS